MHRWDSSDQFDGFSTAKRVQTARAWIHVAWVVGIMMALIMISMIVLPWQQSAFGTGKVIAYVPSERSQSIDAPVDGRVIRWHVLEGATVLGVACYRT